MALRQTRPLANFTRAATLPLVAGVLFGFLAFATIIWSDSSGEISTVWVANAMVLAIILNTSRRRWPAIIVSTLLAEIVASAVTHGSIAGAMIMSAGNAAEILIAGYLLQRFSSFEKGFLHQLDSVVQFVVVAGIVAPFISSLFGACAANLVLGLDFTASWWKWFSSDALGLLAFTPFFYELFSGRYRRDLREMSNLKRAETFCLQFIVLAVSVGIFFQDRYPLLFLTILPTLLVAFRLGWPGTNLAISLTTMTGLVAMVHGHGPARFFSPDIAVQISFYQFYAAVLLLCNLPVAASIAARKELIERLTQSERTVKMLARKSSIVLVSFDCSGKCTQVIGDSQPLLGLPAEKIVGLDIADIAPGKGEILLEANVAALDNPSRPFTAEIELQSGRWLEAIFRASYESNGTFLGSSATISEVTARKHRERKLARIAETDELTGLLNRSGFMNRFNYAIESGEASGLHLAVIDVDRFKSINDRHGHLAGDSVLVEIAARMTSQVGDSGFAARLGGDEFVVLLDQGSREDARDCCARIVACVAETPVNLPYGNDVDAHISCGLVSHIPGIGAEDFLHHADMALYNAKRRGRNCLEAA